VGITKGLSILKKVKDTIGVPVLSDVHSEAEIPAASEVLDVIQIPALLARQTDMLLAAARSGKVINVKKGQFMAPADMAKVAEKVASGGNSKIMLTERGASFGYNNLVSDFRSLPIMAATGYPVIYDATHSVQLPSAQGNCSGGDRKFVPPLARAAVAVGCAGLFIEVHPNPDKAPCDGPNMMKMSDMPKLLAQLKELDKIIKAK